LPPPSLERRLLSYLFWRGEIGWRGGLCWLGRFCTWIWRSPVEATQGNKACLAGVPESMLPACLAWLGLPLSFYPGALARLEWHVLQGHRVYLVTGTPRPLGEAVASRLPVPVIVCATELERRNGVLTGRPDPEGMGEFLCGRAKARVLDQLASTHRLELSRSYAYGDRYSDRWMLGRVGHPFAVNPSRALRWLAGRRGWTVLLWNRRPTSRPQETAKGPTPSRGEHLPCTSAWAHKP